MRVFYQVLKQGKRKTDWNSDYPETHRGDDSGCGRLSNPAHDAIGNTGGGVDDLEHANDWDLFVLREPGQTARCCAANDQTLLKLTTC